MVRAIVRSVKALALKVATYGVMHLIVAIIVAYAITRDWRIALAVGLIEPFFQTIAYSVHDRIWHRIAMKTVTSGVMPFAVAVAVAWVLTGFNWRLALAIGLIEPIVQTVFFTVHDRIWARIEARRARDRKLAAA